MNTTNYIQRGNWLLDVSGLPKKVEEIYDDSVTLGGVLNHISTVKPIPLTAEQLERNGFKKTKFYLGNIEGQHQWTWWNDTLTPVSLWCRELNDDPKNGWMIRIDSSSSPVMR